MKPSFRRGKKWFMDTMPSLRLSAKEHSIAHTTIYNVPQGRLGNVAFRYLASIVFLYLRGTDGEFVYQRRAIKHSCTITDNCFLEIMNIVHDKNMDAVMANICSKYRGSNYVFHGYFQHDEIYKKFKTHILRHIEMHPEELLMSDNNTTQKVIDLLHHPNPEKTKDIICRVRTYDLVLHVRLEDFIRTGQAIDPRCIKRVVQQFLSATATLAPAETSAVKKIRHGCRRQSSPPFEPNICVVVNELTTELERKYVNYIFEELTTRYVIESNDIITDYHIMKNAKVLMCSCSTISWMASLLSDVVEHVYFPNYPHTRIHETFRKPIDNTTYYDIELCDEAKLLQILSNT